MIYVITKWQIGKDGERITVVDCVKATQRKATIYVSEKNFGDRDWFYQMWEKEIE